jgi:hypothetical protein
VSLDIWHPAYVVKLQHPVFVSAQRTYRRHGTVFAAERVLRSDEHCGVTSVRIDAAYPYQTDGMSGVHDRAKHKSQARSDMSIAPVTVPR